MKKEVIVIIIVVSVLSSIGTYTITKTLEKKTQNELIEDFYLAENAVHISPHSIRKSMDKGDNNFILVDLRSQEEYENEHIIGAVNIPAYKDKDTSDYGAVDRIVNSFKTLKENNPGKDIVVYCYSLPCMTGRKVGKILIEHNIYVKSLGIGWNEWRYFWDLWNHEHEWNKTNTSDYIWSGKDPGIPKINTNSTVCRIEGSLSC